MEVETGGSESKGRTRKRKKVSERDKSWKEEAEQNKERIEWKNKSEKEKE